MNKIPCVVIGGGVIGLSCARSMGLLGISTILIEKNSSIGQETSSRNSEVIHSGIYYPSNTFKFKLLDGGLGIHSTIDLNGSVRFGPNVEWLKENDSFEFINTVPNDYTINNSNKENFYKYIREYYPSLPNDSLIPDYAGIRPKLRGPVGCADISTVPFNVDDFYIQDYKIHQINGLVNLFGIESPGLTSSLAIGDIVSKLILSI
eukprot:gene20892-27082_t